MENSPASRPGHKLGVVTGVVPSRHRTWKRVHRGVDGNPAMHGGQCRSVRHSPAILQTALTLEVAARIIGHKWMRTTKFHNHLL